MTDYSYRSSNYKSLFGAYASPFDTNDCGVYHSQCGMLGPLQFDRFGSLCNTKRCYGTVGKTGNINDREIKIPSESCIGCEYPRDGVVCSKVINDKEQNINKRIECPKECCGERSKFFQDSRVVDPKMGTYRENMCSKCDRNLKYGDTRCMNRDLINPSRCPDRCCNEIPEWYLNLK
jgi:hypothetical protein